MNDRLTSEIAYVKNFYQNQLNTMQNNIDSIYSNVDRTMEEYTGIFSSVSCEYGAPEIASAVVPVTVTVTPKAVTANTAVFLTVNGEKIEFARYDTVFTASFSVDMFEEYDTPTFTVLEKDTIYTEDSDFDISLLYSRYIPELNVRFGGSRSYSTSRISFRGDVTCDSQGKEYEHMASFVTIELRVEKNGEVIEKIALQDGEYIDFSKNYAVKGGDILRIRAVAEDTRGFGHEMLIEEYIVGEEETESVHYSIEPRQIYDSFGNLVYENAGYKVDI